MKLVLIGLLFLVGLLVCLEIGYRLGVRRAKSVPNAHEGFGAIEAAVFGIFGLLLSLSFVGATSRLEVRRNLIVEETNAMADAYTHVDLLPESDQPEVRRLFREYVDLRLRISEEPDSALDQSQIQSSRSLQKAILLHAVSASKTGDAAGGRLLLSATNQMMDVATKKTIAQADAFVWPRIRAVGRRGTAKWSGRRLWDGARSPQLAIDRRLCPGSDYNLVCHARHGVPPQWPD
jgi:hypothetical protein